MRQTCRYGYVYVHTVRTPLPLSPTFDCQQEWTQTRTSTTYVESCNHLRLIGICSSVPFSYCPQHILMSEVYQCLFTYTCTLFIASTSHRWKEEFFLYYATQWITMITPLFGNLFTKCFDLSTQKCELFSFGLFTSSIYNINHTGNVWRST